MTVNQMGKTDVTNPDPDLSHLADTFHLDAIDAFGSRAREAADRMGVPDRACNQAGVYLDIGVKPMPGCRLSVREKARLACALEDLFEVGRVDLVVLSDCDPFLAANTIRGERLFARDAYRADEYDLYVLRRAGDLAPLERERIALIMEEEP